jgi:tRNA1Val (adenine37-N6)-methyltransferase
MARHADTLTYDDLIKAAEGLLNPGGRLSVVLPTDCAQQFRRVTFERVWLTRVMSVVTREGEAPKRTLMEFRLSDKPLMPCAESLTIQAADGSYTEDYRRLTEQFYLNF